MPLVINNVIEALRVLYQSVKERKIKEYVEKIKNKNGKTEVWKI